MATVWFEFTTFKSFRKARLPLSPLTVLIGPNASGKSNALEGLQLLSWLSSGRRLGDLFSAIREQELQLRGRADSLVLADEPEKKFGFKFVGHVGSFWIKFQVQPQGLRIVSERLFEFGGSSAPLYEVMDPARDFGSEIRVAYNNFARGGKKPQITCVDSQPVFTQLLTPARFAHARSQRVIPAACQALVDFFGRILFLDPDPRRMRDYSFKAETKLASDGANLSSVLFSLTEMGEKDSILDFVRSLPEQDIDDLDFVATPREEVMVQLVESFGGTLRRVDAPSLSDGTLRVLAVAAALLSAPKGSLVVIEELDNGVHPSRARQLLGHIQAVVKRRGILVLMTTHNPALLDALPDDALPDVVACYRDPSQGDSRLVRLGDLDSYPSLAAQGSLGDLVARGVLDRVLKTRESPEERKQRDLAWLAAV